MHDRDQRILRRLNDIARQLDHNHDMLHAIAEAVAVLAENVGPGAADNAKLAEAAGQLKAKTESLAQALAEVPSEPIAPAYPTFERGNNMANPAVDAMVQAVATALSVEDSAIVAFNGVPKLISDAVTAALANGATAAELAPLTTLAADLTAKSKALSDALIAGTPVTPAQAKAKKP